MKFKINGYDFEIHAGLIQGAVDVHVHGLIEVFPNHADALTWIRAFGGSL